MLFTIQSVNLFFMHNFKPQKLEILLVFDLLVILQVCIILDHKLKTRNLNFIIDNIVIDF